jgi:hypothetical protein
MTFKTNKSRVFWVTTLWCIIPCLMLVHGENGSWSELLLAPLAGFLISWFASEDRGTK